MTEFERKCVENIPPDELRNITDEVAQRTRRAFEQPGLPVVYCTECERMYRREHLMKTPCVVDVVRMEARCSWHFASELEEELCREYMEAHKPKEPFPVAELKHGGLELVETDWKPLMIARHKIPLDLDEFCRL